MNNCGCGNEIHPERYALGYKVCLKCGDKHAKINKPYGSIIYEHKTAGSIQITNKKTFNLYKKISYRFGKKSNIGSTSVYNTSIVHYQ